MREVESIKRRLKRLSLLEDGWVDGEKGKALDKDGLKWFEDLFLKYYPTEFLQKIQQPYIYPTIEGGIRLEWWSCRYDISLEINLQTHEVYLHYLDLESDTEEFGELYLDREKDWDFIKKRIEKMIGGNKK